MRKALQSPDAKRPPGGGLFALSESQPNDTAKGLWWTLAAPAPEAARCARIMSLPGWRSDERTRPHFRFRTPCRRPDGREPQEPGHDHPSGAGGSPGLPGNGPPVSQRLPAGAVSHASSGIARQTRAASHRPPRDLTGTLVWPENSTSLNGLIWLRVPLGLALSRCRESWIRSGSL